MMKVVNIGIFEEHNVIDEAERRELQRKGYVHFHCLLYNKNGPCLQEGCKKSEEECIKFIDRFITCAKRHMRRLIAIMLIFKWNGHYVKNRLAISILH